MRKRLVIYLFLSLSLSFSALASVCDIFIHGHLYDINYFSNMDYYVSWNSSLELEEASTDLAVGILDQMERCNNRPIVLRAHGYGANVVFYILAQGRRFEAYFPTHDFVKIYTKTMSMYSYSGAFNGTPLMDLICSDAASDEIKGIFGDPCIKSLTTSALFHPGSSVTNPGVPIFLVYTTNRFDYSGETGKFLSNYGVKNDDIESGFVNQNDSLFLQSSTRACKSTEILSDEDSNCEKIDENFFIDFMHSSDYSHTGYLNDLDFLYRVKKDE